MKTELLFVWSASLPSTKYNGKNTGKVGQNQTLAQVYHQVTKIALKKNHPKNRKKSRSKIKTLKAYQE